MTTPPGVPAPTAPAGRRRVRRWWIVVAAAVVLTLLVPVAVVLLDDDQPEPAQLAAPDSGGLVGPLGSELAALLVKGRARTFHGTYDLTAPDRRGTLEWWSDGRRVRQDSILEDGGGTVRTSSFKLGDSEAVVCRQDPSQPWVCQRVGSPIGDDPRGLLAGLHARLTGRPLAVRSDQVNGRQARCFSVAGAPASDAVELCSDPDGLPVRLASPESRLDLTALDGSVPDSTFDPPA